MSTISERIAALDPEERELFMRELEKRRKADFSDATLPTILPKPEERHLLFPLSDVQQAYWLGRSGLFDLGSCGANSYREYEISGVSSMFMPLLQRSLDTALQRLIERHEILRMIVLPDGRQQILPAIPPYQVKFVDLRGHDPQSVETELARVRERMLTERAPLDRWPLFELLAHYLDVQRVILHVRVDALLIDGDSRHMLILELLQLIRNPDVVHPSPVCSYRDYALTWAAWQDSQLCRASRDYWLSRLSTLPPGPELPLTTPISPSTPVRIKTLQIELLDSPSYLQLKTLAARVGLSPSSVLMAAFIDVLALWSQSPRFSLGFISTYRPPIHPQIDEILGNFNTFYPLAVNTASGTFEERARRAQQQTVAALEHRYFSGFQVLRELNKSRGSGSKASILVHFNSLIDIERSYPAYLTSRVSVDDGVSFPLQIQEKGEEAGFTVPQKLLAPTICANADGSLLCVWQVVQGVFPAGLTEEIIAAYQYLVHQLATDEKSWQENWAETTRLLMPPARLNQRAAFNATESPLSTEMLHTLFAKQVSKQPGQMAVVTCHQSWTYEQVYRLSNQVGRLLRQWGGGADTLVAIVMEKGWEQVIAVLGVLQAGATFLPLDPGLSSAQLGDLLGQSQVQIVLTQSWIEDRIDWPDGIRRFHVDDSELSDLDDEPLDVVQKPDDVACVIYTSGTTGQSKGVVLEHRALVNTLLDVNERFRVGAEDRLLALLPLDCDLSLYDIFGVLAAGGTIIVPEAQQVEEPAHWAELISQERVTIWNSTPALLERLITHLEGQPESKSLPLRLALLSRDWISLQLPERLRGLVDDIQVASLGGNTEAAIWSIVHPVERIGKGWHSIPYGRPMRNQRVHILNEALEPCPVWVPGQLYVGGSGLARRYWWDEELGSVTFICHPLTGDRLFRTGDMGRFLPDGYIEFLGRESDFQVTVYGYRVALRQVEAVLERHAALRGAVVLAGEGRSGNKRLVAYVLSGREPVPSAEELRRFMEERLPYYMVPAAFVFLGAWPLTPDGKIDRSALPAPELALPCLEHTFVAPRDRLEIELTKIWEGILEKRPLGVRDNFFELGGDSLKLGCMVSQVERTFGRNLSLSTVYKGATIEHFADALRER